MQQSLRMNDLLRTLLKRLRHRWTFELADIEQSSGGLVVKKASTTFISTWQKHLRVSFDPKEGNFENLKTLVEKRMVRKHCMPTTKRKLALAKFGNRKVLQSPQRLDAGWPPGRAGYPWEPPGNQVGTPGREHQALPPWRQHQSIMLSLLNVTAGTSAVRIPSKGTEPSLAGGKLFRLDVAYQIGGVKTQPNEVITQCLCKRSTKHGS